MAAGGGGHGDAQIDNALPFLLLSILIGVGVRLLQRRYSSWIPIPYSVILFLLGLGLTAALGPHGLGKGGMSSSIELWEAVHPHVILYVLLPPLLFESAFAMDFNTFSRVAAQSFMLAVPGILIAVALTAVYIKYFFTTYAWGWSTSFLLSSILCATDPVAVVNVLHELGAPAHYASLVEGESLLNDGSAFVLYRVFDLWERGVEQTAGSVFSMFASLSILGPIWGVVGGYLVYLTLHLVYNDPRTEVTLVTVSIFGMFAIAELTLNSSGVLAVVMFGLFMAKSGKYAMSPQVHHYLHAVLEEISYFANTTIFVMAGLVMYTKVFLVEEIYSDGYNWLYLFINYIMLHVVRGIVVAAMFPIMHKWGYGINARGAFFMVFGGLRGAVGLALGLLVDKETGIGSRERQLINFHVAGIVCLTLLINGTLAGVVYNKLKIFPHPSEFKTDIRTKALQLLQDHMEHSMGSFQHRSSFSELQAVTWRLVPELLPNFAAIQFTPSGSRQYHMKSVGYHFRHERAVAMWTGAARLATVSQDRGHGNKPNITAAVVAVAMKRAESGRQLLSGGATGKSWRHTDADVDASPSPEPDEIHSAKSIHAMHIDKLEQMYEVFFMGLAGTYDHMFGDRLVDGPAMLVLKDSIDAGRAQNARSLAVVGALKTKPFTHTWQLIKTRVQPARGWLGRKAKNLPRSACLSRTAHGMFLYGRVKVALEVLRAFIHGHVQLTKQTNALDNGALTTVIIQDLEHVIEQAQNEMDAINAAYESLANVANTIGVCKAILVRMPSKIKELHVDMALIDESTKDILMELVDERMFDFDSYHPDTFVLGRMHNSHAGHARTVHVRSSHEEPQGAGAGAGAGHPHGHSHHDPDTESKHHVTREPLQLDELA